jgi:two-component system sensor histidine kinase QseC
MKLPRSLQGRLMVMVLGLVVGVWLATAVMTWIDVRHELDELLDSHLAQAAALLVVQQVSEIEDDDHQVDAPSLHHYAPKVAFQVFHEGRLALRSSNAPAGPMLGAGSRVDDGFRTLDIAGTTWRVFATRGGASDVQVFVGEQVQSRASILWAVLRSTLTPMVFALPLLALAVGWAVRQGLSPLRALGLAVEQRDPQALQPVVLEDTPSEVSPTLAALNALFARIDELMTSERRFTADAAHELRTPIAAIRAQAQVALGATDDVERTHALRQTLQGCDRAARLVEQLLTLSRLESSASPELVEVDLAALAREVVAEATPKALAKHQEIECRADGRALVRGDTTLLSVLVRNLVDNAVRYSPNGARIGISVATAADGSVEVSVDDSGPGMTASDMARAGERFFRVVGNGQSGSGLGLSITGRIAEVHQATERITRSASLGGLRVAVQFTGKRVSGP